MVQHEWQESDEEMNAEPPINKLSRVTFLLLTDIDAAIARFEAHPTGTAAEFDQTLRQMRRDRATVEAQYEREKNHELPANP